MPYHIGAVAGHGGGHGGDHDQHTYAGRRVGLAWLRLRSPPDFTIASGMPYRRGGGGHGGGDGGDKDQHTYAGHRAGLAWPRPGSPSGFPPAARMRRGGGIPGGARDGAAGGRAGVRAGRLRFLWPYSRPNPELHRWPSRAPTASTAAAVGKDMLLEAQETPPAASTVPPASEISESPPASQSQETGRSRAARRGRRTRCGKRTRRGKHKTRRRRRRRSPTADPLSKKSRLRRRKLPETRSATGIPAASDLCKRATVSHQVKRRERTNSRGDGTPSFPYNEPAVVLFVKQRSPAAANGGGTRVRDIYMPMEGTTIVDRDANITSADDYICIPINEQQLMLNEVTSTAPTAEQATEANSSPPSGRVYASKAHDVMTTVIARGSVIHQDAVDKAKSFDGKHQLRANATAKINSFDRRVGLSEKLNTGISVVNEKVKTDQRLYVSDKTTAALLAAECKLNDTGSAVKTNRYVSITSMNDHGSNVHDSGGTLLNEYDMYDPAIAQEQIENSKRVMKGTTIVDRVVNITSADDYICIPVNEQQLLVNEVTSAAPTANLEQPTENSKKRVIKIEVVFPNKSFPVDVKEGDTLKSALATLASPICPDSYYTLGTKLLDLDTVLLETSLLSGSRIFVHPRLRGGNCDDSSLQNANDGGASSSSSPSLLEESGDKATSSSVPTVQDKAKSSSEATVQAFVDYMEDQKKSEDWLEAVEIPVELRSTTQRDVFVVTLGTSGTTSLRLLVECLERKWKNNRTLRGDFKATNMFYNRRYHYIETDCEDYPIEQVGFALDCASLRMLIDTYFHYHHNRMGRMYPMYVEGLLMELYDARLEAKLVLKAKLALGVVNAKLEEEYYTNDDKRSLLHNNAATIPVEKRIQITTAVIRYFKGLEQINKENFNAALTIDAYGQEEQVEFVTNIAATSTILMERLLYGGIGRYKDKILDFWEYSRCVYEHGPTPYVSEKQCEAALYLLNRFMFQHVHKQIMTAYVEVAPVRLLPAPQVLPAAEGRALFVPSRRAEAAKAKALEEEKNSHRLASEEVPGIPVSNSYDIKKVFSK